MLSLSFIAISHRNSSIRRSNQSFNIRCIKMPVQTTLSFGPVRKPLAAISPNVPTKRAHDGSYDAANPPPPTKALPTAVPSGLISVNHTSHARVLGHIKGWIAALGTQHRYVGTLGGDGTELKMPLKAADGRQLTWHKFADEVCTFLRLRHDRTMF